MKTNPRQPAHFAQIAQRLFNVPLAIEPSKAEIICAALHQRLGILKVERLDSTVMGVVDMKSMVDDAYRQGRSDKVFHIDSGVAVIPITGTLLHRYGALDPWSGCTGYDGIARKLRAALSDNDVSAIWLDIDSPGGEVAGLFALVREIAMSTQSETGGKPIWAYANEMACSAAYAIASVCDRVYAPKEAIVGSIGSIIMHTDFSEMLDENGIKVTMIRGGERKARGGPYEALDDVTLNKLLDAVEKTRVEFASYVAMGRNLDVDAILATEADWFDGEEADDLGLIDGVGDEREIWDRLMRTLNRSI